MSEKFQLRAYYEVAVTLPEASSLVEFEQAARERYPHLTLLRPEDTSLSPMFHDGSTCVITRPLSTYNEDRTVTTYFLARKELGEIEVPFEAKEGARE